MNTPESNKFSMYRAVDTVMFNHDSIVKSVPALGRATDEFHKLVGDIETLDHAYQTVSKGTVSEKNQYRDQVIEDTDIYCGALYSFGKDTGNMQIVEVSDLSLSDISELRDVTLLEKGKAVNEFIKANLAALQDHGISTDEASAYDVLINNYDESLKKRGDKGASATIARGDLHKQFSKVDVLIHDKLDKLMKKQKKSNPGFFDLYQKARDTKDLGGGHAPSDEKPADTTKTSTEEKETVVA